jgi:uncharacterized protein (DUF427 family)
MPPQFPPDTILDKSILFDSTLTTKCSWKGTASYYNVTVNGNVLKDAAWYYPEPKDAAKNIKDHIAFCKSSPYFKRIVAGETCRRLIASFR